MKNYALLMVLLFAVSSSKGLVSSARVVTIPVFKKKSYSILLSAKDSFSQLTINNWNYVVKNEKYVVVARGNVKNGSVFISNLKTETYFIEAFYCGSLFQSKLIFKQILVQQDTTSLVFVYADTAFVVSGKAIDCETKKPFKFSEVDITSFDSSEHVTTHTDSNGFFYFRTNNLTNYHMLLNADSCYPILDNVYLVDSNRQTTHTIHTEVCGYKVDCNRPIRLLVIINLDRGYLERSSGFQPELDRLISMLNKYPSFKIEIDAHSDSRSSSDYNMDYTQRLSENIKEYLVDKGIDSNRIVAKGFGESQLLNHCTDGVKCSETEHAVNRRRLFKLICE